MISKIGEELLAMEKVAKRVGYLRSPYSSLEVIVHPERKHYNIHVIIRESGVDKYIYCPETQEYKVKGTPPNDIDTAIKEFCADSDNMREIKRIYYGAWGGKR